MDCVFACLVDSKLAVHFKLVVLQVCSHPQPRHWHLVNTGNGRPTHSLCTAACLWKYRLLDQVSGYKRNLEHSPVVPSTNTAPTPAVQNTLKGSPVWRWTCSAAPSSLPRLCSVSSPTHLRQTPTSVLYARLHTEAWYWPDKGLWDLCVIRRLMIAVKYLILQRRLPFSSFLQDFIFQNQLRQHYHRSRFNTASNSVFIPAHFPTS